MSENESNMSREIESYYPERERLSRRSIKELHKTVKEKYLSSPNGRFEGDITYDNYSKDVTIRKINADIEEIGPTAVRLVSREETSPFKEVFQVLIKDFGIAIYVWRFKKHLFDRSKYGFLSQASGEEYESFLDANKGDLELFRELSMFNFINSVRFLRTFGSPPQD